MGTRAAFFIGDPRDVTGREWLGCIASDGYPDGDCESLVYAKSAEQFKGTLASLIERRAEGAYGSDFADPAQGGFPFPWTGDLFLTDYVYAFFDGETQFFSFHTAYGSLQSYLSASDEERERLDDLPDDPTLSNVPAPGDGTWDQGQPDSIIVVST